MSSEQPGLEHDDLLYEHFGADYSPRQFDLAALGPEHRVARRQRNGSNFRRRGAKRRAGRTAPLSVQLQRRRMAVWG